ncbi:MAG: histidine kinase dimerization/phosphoacceptor domain -containing protein [Pseudomonadota bacterium]
MTVPTPTVLRHSADTGLVREMADAPQGFMLSLFDSSPDVIQLIELDGTLSYMSPNGQKAMEIDDFSLVAGRPWAQIWPEESHVKVALALAAAKAGESSRIEIYSPRGDGTPTWYDLSVSPVLRAAHPNGKGTSTNTKVARILAIARNITSAMERDRRLRDDDQQLNASLRDELGLQDVLMREIDHRVKNSLAMIASILRLQSRNAETEATKAQLASAASRVTTVARVHERLQSGHDMTTVSLDQYLPTIAQDVTDALTRHDVALSVHAEPVQMDSERAAALGMIAAELVTNAFKHAFRDRGGQVQLRLEQPVPDRLRMIVRDDGVGGCAMTNLSESENTSEPMKVGLGTRIVQLHVGQLGATLYCHSPVDGGTAFTLDMPLSKTA